ncbi:hypothetical protein JCM10213v2_003878 [Rhodosporidiobolus nylandii]
MSTGIVDSFKVGTKTAVVQDCELRGDITLGSGTVLQPKCTVIAAAGPIIFGSNNIVEEQAIIVNRHKAPLIIGDNNLFEVGCRIESPSIGSHNTFGIKSRVSPHVAVGSNCVVGAGCVVLPSPFPPASSPHASSATPSSASAGGAEAADAPPSDVDMLSASSSPAPPPAPSAAETLPDYTHVFGSENRRRKASSEGTGQAKALFVKHHEYLRETIPKYNKLKMF